MASIFRKDDNYVDKPNRNTFDLSFQNNLTTKFGKLIPCFCQEVIPGDSFRIKPTFGLRFLPQVFPVQTRMRAHVHFFYVRNRTIWKEWMDFIGKTKEGLVAPYLSFNDKAIKDCTTSSIFDYFGLPTQLHSTSTTAILSNNGALKVVDLRSSALRLRTSNAQYSLAYNNEDAYVLGYADDPTNLITCVYHEFVKPIAIPSDGTGYPVTKSNTSNAKTFVIMRGITLDDLSYVFAYPIGNGSTLVPTSIPTKIYENDATSTISLRPIELIGYYTEGTSIDVVSAPIVPASNIGYPIAGISVSSFPYNSDELRISSLPFRAYEAIYNSFYRNAENNPYMLNGVPEYNVYTHNLDGGAEDASLYNLHNRNWEDDAFTTAVPTPQQGNAPLIGLVNQSEELPFRLTFGNDDGTQSTVHMGYDTQSGSVKLYHDNNDLDMPAKVGELNEAMIEAIKFGITINDLRNVNALQLWLEKNVRKGYKYRDQMMSHYGVSISFDDLLMPEFIGGISRDVEVNQISQTVETDTGNLGDIGGQAHVVGSGEDISKFCDEHGFIIGILSVAPVPNYSQIIPKHLLKHDAFDIFFPEFGKIGMQPIANKYLAPLSSWAEGKSELTFGYQRAWWEYFANVDQIHGKFTTEFDDFIIHRKFLGTPELGADFTTIKNEDINNIFYVDDNEDKILGQIYFDVKAIRPIPLFGIPSIE